ncbi:MAG TPA: hypothetical protein VM163_01515 [bacterium]|nr:hypothetical protein [bacterium]
MRGRHCLWILAVLAVLIASQGLLFAGSADDSVERSCNISVKGVELEALIRSILSDTGAVFYPMCPVNRELDPPDCEVFTYTDTYGREVITMDCVKPTIMTITYSTHGDQKIRDVLDALLRSRGYCWWTLGRRVCIDWELKLLCVAEGWGYVHNQHLPKTTIFVPCR